MSQPSTCFFDDNRGTVLLHGVYLCESHAVCNTCLQPMRSNALTCQCDEEGYSGHSELLWCSESCRDAKHPDYDYDYDPSYEETDESPTDEKRQ